jgi:hypothetical protein
MMIERVYIETTFVSYLKARPSRNVVIAAHQQITQEWWERCRGNYALHIAIAATNGLPYLLTWNCRHMANAAMRPLIESVCASRGYKAPIICTPEELMEAKQ